MDRLLSFPLPVGIVAMVVKDGSTGSGGRAVDCVVVVVVVVVRVAVLSGTTVLLYCDVSFCSDVVAGATVWFSTWPVV